MNYPNGIKKNNNSSDSIVSELSHKNRGMTLESELNTTNEYYRSIDKAFIYKKPTPIKITKVDYPSRDKAVIKEAFFTIPSTTDYNGLYKGKYIDFEAKETKSKTSFPKKNIHEHQIVHLEKVDKHGGISFIIIRFTSLNKTYLIFTKDFIKYFEENKEKKSITLSYIEEYGFLIKDGYNPVIDYLKIIDNYI